MKRPLLLVVLAAFCAPVAAQDAGDGSRDMSVPGLEEAPEGETLSERQAAYVDPTRGRGRCADTRPDRPGWVMVHDKSEGPGAGAFAAIGQALYRLRSSESVLELGECSCQLLYPDWSAIRAEYDALTSELVTIDLAVEAKGNLTRKKSEAYGKIRSLCADIK